MATLALRNLSKRFKGSLAVEDVTLDVHSGEFFSILGPSGCGKTTLLRLIAGFELPATGSVVLDGEDITPILPQRRGIGMVFQNYALFPHMTVFQNVAFGLETKKLARERIRRRVEEILESVHLSHKVHTPVPELSGGEQQRVAVARALVVEPAILLFDEPLSNLDVALRLSTREEIRSLQRRTGITTIYVTHDQSEAMSLSDRIAIMQRGRIVQVGTPREVYERPSNAFVAEFLGGANILHGHYNSANGNFVSRSLTLPLPKDRWDTTGKLVLAIKPEAVLFHNSDETHSPCMFKGTILEKEYLGFTTMFVLDVSGTTLRAAGLSSDRLHSLMERDSVPLDIDWSKVAFFPQVE